MKSDGIIQNLTGCLQEQTLASEFVRKCPKTYYMLGIRPICSAHLHRTFFRIDLVSVCLSGIMEGVLSPALFF